VVPVSRRNVAENALVSLKPISRPICVTDIEDSINRSRALDALAT
jgi:hypothetical protein